MAKEYTYSTVVSCMDGRIQSPLKEFATKRFGVSQSDTITDRGGLLRHLPELKNEEYIKNILDSIKLSITPKPNGHGSEGVVIAGHQKCAGYPIPDDQKKKEVIEAADLIRRENPGVEVIPVFVSEDEPSWRVDPL